MKHGKKYVDAAKLVDRTKLYDTNEALDHSYQDCSAKFDETVELHVSSALTAVMLTSRLEVRLFFLTVQVKRLEFLQFVRAPNEELAKEAGADFVGAEDMTRRFSRRTGWTFDVAYCNTRLMGLVGRLGKILGPRGLMPNPKAGTVTPDIAKAVKEAKAGKIEYRLDKTNIIHCPIGKASFGAEKLGENLDTLMGAIVKAKPAAAKGQYIRSVAITSTMGPSVRINPAKFGA